AQSPRPADGPPVPARRPGPRGGGRRRDRAPPDRLHPGGRGRRRRRAEEGSMATAAALLTVLLLAAGHATARGTETDPARRSLVVDAVEKASPAVVNVSTEQIVERRAFRFPQDPFFEEFFRDFV